MMMGFYTYIYLALNLFSFRQTSAFLTNTASFSQGTSVGVVTDHSIGEASGLALSRDHKDVSYTHNDKGDRSRIFALASNGTLLATLEINNAGNYDWEDIAVGKCPDAGTRHCIYIGDTGNHAGDGSKKIIYVVQEPTVIQNAHLDPIRTLHYQWNVLDTETLMVDPNGNVILISKVHGGLGQIGLIPATAFNGHATFSITRMATISIPPTTHNDPVGGDISPDGMEVLIRTHKNIYYWTVSNGDYVGTMSTVMGTEVPAHKEHQGEAVAWDVIGSGYYTLSEGHNEPIYYYRRI